MKEPRKDAHDFNIDLSGLYFTPDLEEIRVGYECEKNDETKWYKSYIYLSDFDEINVEGPEYWLTKVRVPYLTKEQIEAQGWKKEGGPKGYWNHQYKKKDHYLIYCEDSNHLEILSTFIPEENCLFSGICKDINTFGYICKLLEI